MSVIRTIAGQVKEFKRDSFLTPLMMLLEVVMEMIIPLLLIVARHRIGRNQILYIGPTFEAH